MIPIPEVKLDDWIKVGERDALISDIRPERIEVVYMDGRPSNCDIIWIEDHWEFTGTSGYADKYSRLNRSLDILKTGKKYY